MIFLKSLLMTFSFSSRLNFTDTVLKLSLVLCKDICYFQALSSRAILSGGKDRGVWQERKGKLHKALWKKLTGGEWSGWPSAICERRDMEIMLGNEVNGWRFSACIWRGHSAQVKKRNNYTAHDWNGKQIAKINEIKCKPLVDQLLQMIKWKSLISDLVSLLYDTISNNHMQCKPQINVNGGWKVPHKNHYESPCEINIMSPTFTTHIHSYIQYSTC